MRDKRGTKGFEKKVRNGHFREQRVRGQEDKRVPQGEGEGSLRVSGSDDGEDFAKLGDFSPVGCALLPMRRYEEGVLLSSSRTDFIFPGRFEERTK